MVYRENFDIYYLLPHNVVAICSSKESESCAFLKKGKVVYYIAGQIQSAIYFFAFLNNLVI